MSNFKYQTLDESSGFILFKLNAIWKEKLETVFSKAQITQTQYALLASLMWFEQQENDLSQQELADHLKIEKMTLSKAIRKLEEKNFIIREIRSNDSRAWNIKLQSTGRTLAKKLIKEIEDLDEEFFGKITKAERLDFNNTSLKLIAKNKKEPVHNNGGPVNI